MLTWNDIPKECYAWWDEDTNPSWVKVRVVFRKNERICLLIEGIGLFTYNIHTDNPPSKIEVRK